jgi:hypothetical protein
MPGTDARRVAPVLLVLVAVAGLLGTGQGDERTTTAFRNSTTAVWATTAGIEAVLPAKLETALDRSGLATSSKQRSPLAVLVPAMLLGCAVARRAKLPVVVPEYAAVSARTRPERGPPLRRFALT